jgi:hypothetical protein
MVDAIQTCRDRVLCARIVGEYLEMPGLNPTVAQAARLWDIDRVHCRELLESLVASRFLRRSGERYVRTECGRIAA